MEHGVVARDGPTVDGRVKAGMGRVRSLAYRPKKLTARTDGDWAEVTITGDANATQPHLVKCVREDGHWRVVLELPPLPPIQRRFDAGI